MRNKLQLIFALSFLCIVIHAQVYPVLKTRTGGLSRMIGFHAPVMQNYTDPTCYTVSLITASAVSVESALSDTSTPGCSPNAGYVDGSNCYGDKEKANFYASNTYSAVTSPSVSQVLVTFYKNGNLGTGGSNSVSVVLMLYSGTSNSIAPGPAISATSATMQDILAAQGGTANTLFNYSFVFANPVPVPAGGFFASVSIPNTPGDTVVIPVQNPVTIGNSWEKEADNSWRNMDSAWANFHANLAIFPIVCGNLTSASVKEVTAQKYMIDLGPNPSNGRTSLFLKGAPFSGKFTVKVTNALGETIQETSAEKIRENVLPLDLSQHPNGLYFVSVINQHFKIVKRLIIDR